MNLHSIFNNVRRIIRSSVSPGNESTDLASVHNAYELILQRPIDEDGKTYWEAQIKSGNFSRPLLVDTLVNSPEYQMLKKTPFRYPTERYLNTVKEGYKDCDLDTSYLFKSLNEKK